MALHWKALKGFYGTTSTNVLYTYIQFKNKQQEGSPTTEAHRPTIAIGEGSEDPTSLGYIVCNDVENFLKQFLHFNNTKGIWWETTGLPNTFACSQYKAYTTNGHNFDIILPDSGPKSGTNYNPEIQIKQGHYKNDTRNLLTIACFKHEMGYLRIGRFIFDSWFNDASSHYSEHEYQIETQNIYNEISERSGYPGKFQIYSYDGVSTYENYVHVAPTDDDSYYYRFTKTDFYSKNPLHALYFDAISDKRAKEQIHLLSTSALSIVKNVQVYSFIYKENKQKAIGLIAQDLLNIDLDGFNLVSNLQASGKDHDFMEIHESKLIYVLWKAVQELSAQVEELKKELNK